MQSQPPPPPSASGPRRLLSIGRRILRSKSPPSAAALGGSMPASTASLVPPVPAIPDVANSGTAPRRKLTLMQALPGRRRTASFHGMRAAREAAAAAAAYVAAGDGQQPALHEQEVYSNDMDDYEVHETIGYGASAHVVLAKYKPTGHNLAIKIVDLDRFERCQIDELRKEIQVMSLCRHPHLLPVYRSFAVGKHLHLVMPLRTAGAVSSLLRHHFPRGMPEVAIATILAQVLQGVAYLHQHGLIHRDIKSGNILLDRETGIVQLGDFGVSSSLCEGVHRQSRRSFVGSLLWMAPEVMEQSGADARHLPSSNTPGYNSKADIYSLGITVLEMAQGRAPYAQFPPLKVCLLVLNNAPPTLDRARATYKYSRSLKDLIDQCLMRQPSLRPSAAKLQQLPFLKRARKPITLVKALDLVGLPPLTATPLTNGDDDLPTLDAWDFDASYVPQAPLETIAASPFDQTHAPHTPWSAMGTAAASYESHGTDGSSPPTSAPGTPPATAVNSMPMAPPIPPPPSAPAPASGNGRDRTNSVMEMFASPA
ncbi:STE/STE20/FRAY protein kinase [Allomyces macrogynus ATCC 38327]|uniref:STE/STE20/FRAY protein kinase n=1 Tax=Allomyces macrogynus (strain ATCC 38327) TaxID=578462 RepID=A0A0L0STF1_ALLM3|nr:STE/STE20/FRAY protein kinase [Allomyces macrogynus ATCC 38327]|eukprot:KNE65680.1 STE/STE20/FRAY protein kinase [Allomyces macrogynus ATCC 38327]